MSTGTGTGIDRTSVADPPLPQQEKPPGRMVSSLWRRGPFWALLAIMIVLVVLPIGMLLLASLTDSTPRPGDPVGNFTLDNFQALFSDRGIEAMVNSVLMALGAGAVAMSIGAALAWLAARSDVPARPLVQLAGIIPLFISGFVGAMAWSLVASPQSGYVNMLLRELTLASALGAGGANSALILVPVSAVDRGLGPADGALALAIGGAVSAFGRVLIGAWIDRRGVDPSRVAAVIMLAGAATLAVSVLARSSVPFLVVTGLALMGTGSWQGLLVLGAVQRRIDRPGAASGAMASSAQLATGITLLGLSAVTAHRSAIEAFWVPVILLGCAALMVLASTVVRPRVGK